MAINPINFSRVTHNLQTLSLLDSLRRNTMNLFTEQNKLASGLRLNSPSDDPVLASKALNLSEVLDAQEQILLNVRYADAFLTATDNGMSDIADLLTEARATASSMVNSYVRSDERAAEAEIIGSIIDQLMSIGNRAYNDVYLFGGKKTTTPPFVRKYGGVYYAGDTTNLTTDIGGPDDPVLNLTGDKLFAMDTGRVTGYRNLEPAATAATRLDDIKGATSLGIRLSSLQIVINVGAMSFNVDLTGSATLGDVIDKINAAWQTAGGAGNLASIFGTGLRLDTGGAGPIEVRESGNGSIASDLGILKSGPGGIIVGDNLHARITNTTAVSSLNGGAGINLASPILITNGLKSATVDLSGAQTVQDILNIINTTDLGVKASINSSQTGFDVVNYVSGVSMSIAEQGGGHTADNLGILTLHGGTTLASLNHGGGVKTGTSGPDFRIFTTSGASVDVSVVGAKTVQDVLNAINSAAAAAGVAVTAALNPSGTGIRIDDATGGAGTLRIERLNMSPAIDGLGLNKSAPAGQTYLISDDVAGVRPDSIFTVLMDLQEALRRDDTAGIDRAAQALERLAPDISRLHGIVGARSKAMHDRVTFTEDAVQATKTLLSEVKDLDYTEAITKFQQAQTALQANLMTGSRLLSISLLDYLT